MSHLNKQLEVNHRHALEHYLAEQDRKEQLRNRLDRLGLGLMMICGLIGLFYTITNADAIFNRDKKAASSSLTPYAATGLHQPDPHKTTTAATAVAADMESSEKMVHITGAQKVGAKLDFHIDHFHPAAKYEFDFGNGVTRQATREHLAFVYNDPGTYQVELKVTYEGESQIAYSEMLTIRY